MPTEQYTGLVTVEDDTVAQKIPTINQAFYDLGANVSGILEKSVAGSSDVTLTRLEALRAAMKFTGALTGPISVKIPATGGAARLFVVWNATSGAHALTVKTTAGGSTGIAITQGKAGLLFHDGTNVMRAAAEAP